MPNRLNRPTSGFRWSSVGRVFCLLPLLLLLGCQTEEQLLIVPVEGSVNFGGKPIPGAMVVLHPQPGSDPRIQPARGTVDQDGKFKITTNQSGDGAAVGDYLVTVIHTPLVKKEGDIGAGPNVLPPKYESPATTDLKVTVVAESPNVLDLKLTR